MQFLTFFILIAGALFVRLYGLSDYAFNQDEAWHLVIANQNSLWDVIQFNFREEVHPPLSPIIWHFMLKVSSNEIWLRLSSIVAGVLLIPSAYYFGRLYIGRTAGFVMALICAFGTLPVIISTTIRAYSMLMLALTWMMIFAKKFRDDAQRKNLIYYTLCAFVAIELHHAAAFILFASGSWLMLHFFLKRDKKNFFILAAIHVALALLVLCYVPILKNIYGFSGNYGYFWRGDLINYLYSFFGFTAVFPFGDNPSEAASVVFLFATTTSLISLIRTKKFLLLWLVLMPITVLSFADYFRIYPFSQTFRNNLFLFFTPLIIYGSFAQICVEKIPNFSKMELPLALVFTALMVTHAYKNNIFENSLGIGCLEFNVTKKDRQLLFEKLAEKNVPGNIFVTVNQKIWDLQFNSGGKGRITILTKNLAKFESDEITTYFTAFPGREKDTTLDLVDYKLFFSDLFAHLKSQGEFKKLRSITFFDFGLANDFMSVNFHPQFVKAYPTFTLFSTQHELDSYRFYEESYAFSWAINSSKEVISKFNAKNKYCAPYCGREIFILSFTPKFVAEEILSKNFVSQRELQKSDTLRINKLK